MEGSNRNKRINGVTTGGSVVATDQPKTKRTKTAMSAKRKAAVNPVAKRTGAVRNKTTQPSTPEKNGRPRSKTGLGATTPTAPRTPTKGNATATLHKTQGFRSPGLLYSASKAGPMGLTKNAVRGIDQVPSPSWLPRKKGPSGLKEFGIKQSMSPSKVSRREGNLQFAFIKGPTPCLLLKFSPNGFWGEKKLFDALRERQPWLMSLEPHPQIFNYHVNNVAVRNARGYSIRVFAFFVGEIPAQEAFVRMGEYICTEVNDMEGNNTTASVDPDNLFFVDGDDGATVWSDVLGMKQAYEQMLQLAGEDVSEQFYARHTPLVHSFFRSGTLHPELAQTINAPNYEVLGWGGPYPEELFTGNSSKDDFSTGATPEKAQEDAGSKERIAGIVHNAESDTGETAAMVIVEDGKVVYDSRLKNSDVNQLPPIGRPPIKVEKGTEEDTTGVAVPGEDDGDLVDSDDDTAVAPSVRRLHRAQLCDDSDGEVSNAMDGNVGVEPDDETMPEDDAGVVVVKDGTDNNPAAIEKGDNTLVATQGDDEREDGSVQSKENKSGEPEKDDDNEPMEEAGDILGGTLENDDGEDDSVQSKENKSDSDSFHSDNGAMETNEDDEVDEEDDKHLVKVITVVGDNDSDSD